jgi:hypothetical protein
VKADDAATPIPLWDERVWCGNSHEDSVLAFKASFNKCPLSSLRLFLLRRWKLNVRRSFILFLKRKYGDPRDPNRLASPEAQRDIEVGRECLWHAVNADWWDWSKGSRPFFWRWPAVLQCYVRDGFPPFMKGDPPAYRRPKPREKDPDIRDKVTAKLQAVKERRCIQKGKVQHLTSYFSVSKGDQDIRMVYDASKSDLNSSLWAPSFGLPTVDTLTRSVEPYFWMGDRTLERCS